MPHKTRLVLFYSFVLIFLALGSLVLAFSYGWRIDFETGKIQKIGAIYIKTNLRDVTIKINDKIYPDASGLLQSGTLISNLLPKTYRVTIDKTGYLPYRKTVTVQPSRVEELLNVQLIPETFDETFIAPAKGTAFIDATESADKMILQNATSGTYYLYDRTNASSTLNLTMAIANAKRGQKIKRIAFVPFKPTQFIIEDASGLKLFDSEKKTVESLLNASIVYWNMNGSTIIGAETAGGVSSQGKPSTTAKKTQRLFMFNLVFRSKTVLDDLNTQLTPSTSIAAIDATDNFGMIAYSDTKGTLSLFTAKDKTLRQIADNVRSFTFSPDGKKLLILGASGHPTILFVEDFDGDIRKKAGDTINVALPHPELTTTVHWYADSYHLLVEQHSELFITELDDRKPLNIFPLIANFIDYHYIPQDRSIYITDTQGIQMIRIER